MVQDDGPGIGAHEQGRVFDRLYTGDRVSGSGLGLAIARTILESYGGDIWAENRQRGAVFCFRLPLAKAAAE